MKKKILLAVIIIAVLGAGIYATKVSNEKARLQREENERIFSENEKKVNEKYRSTIEQVRENTGMPDLEFDHAESLSEEINWDKVACYYKTEKLPEEYTDGYRENYVVMVKIMAANIDVCDEEVTWILSDDDNVVEGKVENYADESSEGMISGDVTLTIDGYTTKPYPTTWFLDNYDSRPRCESCNKKVSSVIEKKDAAGEYRRWCKDCWDDYDEIIQIDY